MKIEMKLIFPAAIAVALMTLSARMPPPLMRRRWPTPAPIPSLQTRMRVLGNDGLIVRRSRSSPKATALKSSRANLDEVVLGVKSAAAAHGETIPPEQMMGIESQMLNRLIQIQLLLQTATDADKADGKSKADVQISNLLERAGSQEAFDRQLKAVGMTPDELRTKVTQEATATAALTRELGVTVTRRRGDGILRRATGGF